MELFLDVARAAKLFSISRTTIRSLIRKGRLRSYKLNPKGKHLVRPLDLERVIVRKVSRRKRGAKFSRKGLAQAPLT